MYILLNFLLLWHLLSAANDILVCNESTCLDYEKTNQSVKYVKENSMGKVEAGEQGEKGQNGSVGNAGKKGQKGEPVEFDDSLLRNLTTRIEGRNIPYTLLQQFKSTCFLWNTHKT